MGLREQAGTGAALGLGLAALGRPGYINLGHDADVGADRSVEGMRRHAHAVLDAAWDLGIRYVDAARSYGLAERFLGAWLADRPGARDALRIGSKWGYAYTAGWQVDADQHEVKEHSLAQLQQQWSETCAELGTAPDLYQIHSVTPDSPALDDGPLLDQLATLRGEGVELGLTTSGPDQAAVVERSLEVDVDGQRLFASVQATWNLLERSVEGALAAAHAAGVEIIVKEALANGRLTARGDPAIWQPLRERADALGVGVDAVALAAARSQPWAGTVLSGAATVAQLASNAAAARIELSAEELGSWSGMAEQPKAYWATRAALPWT
jgi:aryl-alcohol dehydrogenase-like predicted oxidoreductase